MKKINISIKLYIIFSFVLSIPLFRLSIFLVSLLEKITKYSYFNYLEKLGVIEVPTTLGLLFLCIWLFDKYLWKVFFINKIFSIPNINGRFEGYLVSSFDEKIECPIVIEIRQDFNKLNVSLYSERSSSYSINAEIYINSKGNKELLYFYINNTSALGKDSDMRDHLGLASLEIFSSKNNLRLSGSYFNNPRERGRYGTIKVTFKSKKIKGCF